MSSKDAPTSGRQHEIYPKRYFDAAPTWNAWNKLTASDVHNSLHTEAGFEGQNIYFYHNHPIRYVRIVGLLVDIDLKAKGKYAILTIDDSSGACIDVKLERRKAEDAKGYLDNTTVDNVDVKDVTLASGIPTLVLDFNPIPVGSVLEVKGTISTFRGTRQIDLKRLFLVKDTNAEARAWSRTAEWKRAVLSEPWVLGVEKSKEIDDGLKQKEKHERNKARMKKEWALKHAGKKKAHDEKAEARRQRAAEKLNAGALKGTNLIPAPWD